MQSLYKFNPKKAINLLIKHNTMECLTILTITLLFSFTSPTQIMPAASHLKKGFSLELIHRDSIHSPLYPGNLPSTEGTKRVSQFSKIHILALNESSSIEPEDTNIRPIVTNDRYMYTVRMGVGDPRWPLHLLLDTDSSLVWTQSEPCTSCFPQDGPNFNPKRSKSFRWLPCNHTLCKPPSYTCIDGRCRYTQRYAGGSFTKGALATDLVTFASRSGQAETIPNLVFGCSGESSPTMLSRKVGGVMGMDLKEESLIMQLASRIHSPLRFSYCFPHDTNAISYLRFGQDIVSRSNLQSTPMLERNYGLYHIVLEGVSVNGHRVPLPSGVFRLRSDGSGGCTTDSGSSYAHMIRQPYELVKAKIKSYFERFNLSIVDGRDVRMDLCYARPHNFSSFPPMDYHFAGAATLHVEGQNLFQVMGNRFCMLLLPNDQHTIIGAALQRNVQFIYDLTKERVYFGPANCAQV